MSNYAKITQAKLAYRAGIDDKYYGRIERSESKPTIQVVEKLCKALGISLVEFFLLEDDSVTASSFKIKAREARLIGNSIKEASDIHFNRGILLNDHESSIWYNGYVASILFDEFECRLVVKGNVKAKLFINNEVVLELNDSDVGADLGRFIKDDSELNKLAMYSSVERGILSRKKGNALFIEESNWIAGIIYNSVEEEIIDEITFDTDNIFEALDQRNVLFDYIFKC